MDQPFFMHIFHTYIEYMHTKRVLHFSSVQGTFIFFIYIFIYFMKQREQNQTLKVHEKSTHNKRLIEGMKSGLKPDISDDERDDDDDVRFLVFYLNYFE